ncbi:uncharacterized protein HaLaN_12988, partial [Haematococcus lacustris]
VRYYSPGGPGAAEGLQPGDVLASNHPQLAGGSHLPDITVITPVFQEGRIVFFVASRGHHADIGGISPGSMPPASKLLVEEGAAIVSFKLAALQEEGITQLLLAPGQHAARLPGCSGTRALADNLSDLRAQVGGNVLTSQRVTDVVLRAFQAAAASQGCMNNLTFGDEQMGYYETIAGGAGAGPGWHGRSGVHTHMTNTRITDPEILERRYPVVLRRFELRSGSGGGGQWKGGDGVVREP